MSLRVLITGAAGFVGRHLVDALAARSARIVCLTRQKLVSPHSSDFNHDIENVVGDVTDESMLDALLASEPFDWIFHLAGRNGFAPMMDIYRTNVLGTAALLRALHKAGRPTTKVILLGSSAEYGDGGNDRILESNDLLPVNDYGVSKLAAYRMSGVFQAATGFSVSCARPFNIVGPGQREPLLVSSVAAKLARIERGELPPILETGTLDTYRDFVDVRDVVAALIAIAQYGASGEAYNICSGTATQARQVVMFLAGLLEKPLEIRAQTALPKPTDIPYQRGSYEKLQRATGWAPAISLEESLKDTLAFWRNASS